MKIVEELQEIKKCKLNHWGEEDGARIIVINHQISSQSIWGGDGDRDVDMYIYLTPEGWIEEKVTSEIGTYQRNDGVISREEWHISEESIEEMINSNQLNLREVSSLFELYFTLKHTYPLEFKAF